MKKHFVLCINDGGYPESFEEKKLYEVLDDLEASKEDLVCIVDERKIEDRYIVLNI